MKHKVIFGTIIACLTLWVWLQPAVRRSEAATTPNEEVAAQLKEQNRQLARIALPWRSSPASTPAGNCQNSSTVA
jgi:hypothetical protein